MKCLFQEWMIRSKNKTYMTILWRDGTAYAVGLWEKMELAK